MLVRLQKFLAEAGVASRRHSEELIQQGNVTVNGQTVTVLGAKMDPATDHVAVNGRTIRAERKVYIALHKPAGVICTNHDTHGRRRVVDLLPTALPRLYPVGRLDQETTGLLLLTNDGNFSLQLTHPRYKIPKMYEVDVEGELTGMQIAQLLQGVPSDGERLRAERVFDVRSCSGGTELRMVLREGKKRQIRRMMAVVGHPVRRLVRLAVGAVSLGNLKPGQWRYLSNEEVKQLMQTDSTDPDRQRCAGQSGIGNLTKPGGRTRHRRG